jgi:lysophospholipase L1-like esterase
MLFSRTAVPIMAVACLMGTSVLAVQAEKPDKVTLKKGDRIVFLGDSITQAGVGPRGYITLIKKSLQEKHKNLGIEIIGAGISGNKVPDLQKRLEKDVLAKKPTIVFIYIGINDVWHGEKDPSRGTPKDKFEAGLKEILGKLKKAGAQAILCTPTVIGEKNDGSNKNDKKLDAYSAISRKVANELHVPLCDLREVFLAYLKKHNPDNKSRGILTGDTVHLSDAGNKVVAHAMLHMRAVGSAEKDGE